MRLLIDESLPRDLKRYFPGHQATTVPEHGWASKSNGELLRLASEEFDVFVTADQNLEYQQNVSKYEIGVLVLVAPSNRLEDLAPLIPVLLDSLAQITSGQLVRIGV